MSQLSSFASQLQYLTKTLSAFTSLWQVKAFECQQLPWQANFPVLAQAVWAIDDEQIASLDVNQTALVSYFLPALQQDLSLAEATTSQLFKALTQGFKTKDAVNPAKLDEHLQAHFSAHIKGRKWQQITAFSQHIPADNTPILEWCAGKGHLGRYLAKINNTAVTSLEWQSELCKQGQAFATRWQLAQNFQCADVFALDTSPLLAQQHAVALHACGDLHVRLLKHAVQANTQAVSISPCCYHLIQAPQYQVLSSIAAEADFVLSRHDLQLPLQQSVIANPAQQQLRVKEVAWRLGFDSLQRHITGRDSYLPIPSVKRSQLSGEFAAFCQWAGACKGVEIPTETDFDAYLSVGLERQRLTQRIDLIAHLFRTALENWLVLDRVCYLNQQGYQVDVFEFCANSVTPRNTLIQAIKNQD